MFHVIDFNLQLRNWLIILRSKTARPRAPRLKARDNSRRRINSVNPKGNAMHPSRLIPTIRHPRGNVPRSVPRTVPSQNSQRNREYQRNDALHSKWKMILSSRMELYPRPPRKTKKMKLISMKNPMQSLIPNLNLLRLPLAGLEGVNLFLLR